MNRLTFVYLATLTSIFSGVLAGCSDRDTDSESTAPVTQQPADHVMNPGQKMTGDGKMDHESMGQMQDAGGHDEDAAHEEQESMTHDHGEHANMQGASHWNAPAEAATLVNPVVADDASVKRGRSLYAMNCIACHGATGRGDGPISSNLNPKPADLAVMAPMHPGGDFFWKIANGRGPMPAWKDTLDENQTWDLVNYIKSLGTAEPPEPTAEENDGHDHDH